MAPQAPSAATAVPSAPPAPAAAETGANPFAQAVGALVDAADLPGGNQTASRPGDWALQFAAAKSETEAKAAAARLNAKYAPALKGATVAVQKIEANGETTYAVRVPSLSKADAAALCERMKGRDCALVK